MLRIFIFVLLSFVCTVSQIRDASAAPQVLAAIPMGEPIQLECHDSICEVALSAICLQPRRPLPTSGTPYKIHIDDLGAIALLGRSADGRVINLPTSLLKAASYRGQTAVRIFIDSAILEQEKLNSITVNFDRMIVLVPAPKEDDSAPQTAADLKTAVTEVRRNGQAWAHLNSNSMTVAQITMRITNSLPKMGWVSNVEANRLFLLAAGKKKSLSPRVFESAHQLMALCLRRSEITPVRVCLGEFHDQIMLGLNGRYWSGLNPGS